MKLMERLCIGKLMIKVATREHICTKGKLTNVKSVFTIFYDSNKIWYLLN